MGHGKIVMLAIVRKDCPHEGRKRLDDKKEETVSQWQSQGRGFCSRSRHGLWRKWCIYQVRNRS